MDVVAKRGRGRCPAVAHPLRDRAHARPAILEAARKLFKSEAYSAISVERIAATAFVTRHTLRNHFSSIDEIFKCSRELLLAEVESQIEDGIPVRMEPLDGVLYFLEHCFCLFSTDANLELVKSIVHEGARQLWLVEAHQRRIRARLIRNCETYLLYRASRADTLLSNPQIIAEQLLMTAESVVYGPYGQNSGNAQPPSWRAKQFNIAARSVASMLACQDKSAIQAEEPTAPRNRTQIG